MSAILLALMALFFRHGCCVRLDRDAGAVCGARRARMFARIVLSCCVCETVRVCACGRTRAHATPTGFRATSPSSRREAEPRSAARAPVRVRGAGGGDRAVTTRLTRRAVTRHVTADRTRDTSLVGRARRRRAAAAGGAFSGAAGRAAEPQVTTPRPRRFFTQSSGTRAGRPTCGHNSNTHVHSPPVPHVPATGHVRHAHAAHGPTPHGAAEL